MTKNKKQNEVSIYFPYLAKAIRQNNVTVGGCGTITYWVIPKNLLVIFVE